MVAIRQRLIAFDDTEEFGPLLDKLAMKECDPGERPSRSKIIRRAIRAELVKCGMIRERKRAVSRKGTETQREAT